jgi:hypothetical protein
MSKINVKKQKIIKVVKNRRIVSYDYTKNNISSLPRFLVKSQKVIKVVKNRRRNLSYDYTNYTKNSKNNIRSLPRFFIKSQKIKKVVKKVVKNKHIVSYDYTNYTKNSNNIVNVKINHNAGFFSCCSVKLDKIVEYINKNKKIPLFIDSSQQFSWYKNDNNRDITYDYFEHYDNITDTKIINPIDYVHTYQYINYSNLDYKNIIPLIKKYFSPSNQINTIINNIEQKYNLDYENTCVLFYRGNDKVTETTLSNYDEYSKYINELISKNPKIKFLIQSDETEFIEVMTNILLEKCFYFKDEIRHINKSNTTVDKVFKEQNFLFSKYYLAITIIMSKCKYILCGSGNCSIWIMFFRGNCNNVYQYLNDKMIIHEMF